MSSPRVSLILPIQRVPLIYLADKIICIVRCRWLVKQLVEMLAARS